MKKLILIILILITVNKTIQNNYKLKNLRLKKQKTTKIFKIFLDNLKIVDKYNRLKKLSKIQKKIKQKLDFFKITQTKEDCRWEENLEDIKADYPTIIKDRARFIGNYCDEQKCLQLQEMKNIAMCKAIAFPIIENRDAIYYVNTMRLQKKNLQNNKEDFLNQFTFAVLPMSSEEMDENYKPMLFTVVVPILKSELPYYMVNCPFDYSKYKQKDLQDDLEKNCDYNIENKNEIKLVLDKANIGPEDQPEDMHKEIQTQMRFTK